MESPIAARTLKACVTYSAAGEQALQAWESQGWDPAPGAALRFAPGYGEYGLWPLAFQRMTP